MGSFFWSVPCRFQPMRAHCRWLEPLLTTPRGQRKKPLSGAQRARTHRVHQPHWRKHWEHAVKVEKRHTAHYPKWTNLRVPRGSTTPKLGDYCVYVECSLTQEPTHWPRGKVVGVVGQRLIVQRINFVGVTTRAQMFTAVLPSFAWKVARTYHG